jgi:hypothetical protein
VAVSQRELGVTLQGQGRYPEAEALLLESWRTTRARLGQDPRGAPATVDEIVALYDDWGRPAEAERYRRLRDAP